MCGICGFVNYKKKVDPQVIEEMAKAQRHRGPDDMGTFTQSDGDYQLALGHVRLSILDLSMLGHQPMTFLNLIIVFNGEIYNYKEIRNELIKKGHSFQSNCDTEVILHAFKEWGTTCVDRFIGMFAFAIYDKEQQKLYLFRDRAGVKPLFYYHTDDVLVFASELKSFSKFPYFEKRINHDVLYAYMTLGYIPDTQCIFENAHKLQSGSYLEYDLYTNGVQIHKYWDIQDFYNKPKLSISYEVAQESLIELFKSAFGYRLISDVPVGLFLSGGYDSTLVASIITKELGVNLNTFTIGFTVGNNEAPDAELIANHLGTNHTSYYCTPEDALGIIPDLPYYYDEPFADSSAIPTILVSKLSKERVKVVLSADGGDEEFAGYNSYPQIYKQYNHLTELPAIVGKLIPSSKMLFHTGSYKFQKKLDSANEFFHQKELDYRNLLISKMLFPNSLVDVFENKINRNSFLKTFEDIKSQSDSLEYALLTDYKIYMKDDILVKVDRATMSVSIEGREPLIDHRISEFSAQLPLSYKYNNGVKKRILRDIVHRYVPYSIMDKPKRGFSMPIDRWLRTSLNDYLRDMLSEDNLQKSSLDFDKVNNLLQLFLNNQLGYDVIIWRILQYQSWYQRWMVI